ncbi:MAG: ADYC domain-containing protein [Rhodospirillaceae bacterium]
MKRVFICALVVVGCFTLQLLSPAKAASASIRSVTVVGTEFRVVLEDGRLLKQEELVGAVLLIGDGTGDHLAVRVDRVLKDPMDRDGEVTLYELSQHDQTGAWANMCQPDPDGNRYAFPIAGIWTKNDHHHDDPMDNSVSPARPAPMANASASVINHG